MVSIFTVAALRNLGGIAVLPGTLVIGRWTKGDTQPTDLVRVFILSGIAVQLGTLIIGRSTDKKELLSLSGLVRVFTVAALHDLGGIAVPLSTFINHKWGSISNIKNN
jgi:spore maturation protein SpmA